MNASAADVELLKNVLLSAAGGHTLMRFAGTEENTVPNMMNFVEHEDYREHALEIQAALGGGSPLEEKVNIYFAGDDVKQEGNDKAGYEKVGVARAMCFNTHQAVSLAIAPPRKGGVTPPSEIPDPEVQKLVQGSLVDLVLRSGKPTSTGPLQEAEILTKAVQGRSKDITAIIKTQKDTQGSLAESPWHGTKDVTEQGVSKDAFGEEVTPTHLANMLASKDAGKFWCLICECDEDDPAHPEKSVPVVLSVRFLRNCFPKMTSEKAEFLLAETHAFRKEEEAMEE